MRSETLAKYKNAALYPNLRNKMLNLLILFPTLCFVNPLQGGGKLLIQLPFNSKLTKSVTEFMNKAFIFK